MKTDHKLVHRRMRTDDVATLIRRFADIASSETCGVSVGFTCM
jgi:hypothetical protein